MAKKTQNEKDLEYIAKIDQLLSKKVEFLAYFVALIACLAAHVLYFALFAVYGIREMAIFNAGSVLFYIATIVLARRVKEKLTLVYLSVAEIIVHAAVATVFVGMRPNFAMFLLMIIPIVFLMPNKIKAIPFIVMGISILLYHLLWILDGQLGGLRYELQTHEVTVLYVINALIGTFVLIYVTYIYTLTKLYQEAKLRVQNESLKFLANVDPLTRLSNRRAMNEELKRIVSETRQSEANYVVGLGDIDNFKRVNDTYGHDYGDVVLSEVAKILQENMPKYGCAARWGGEEFLFAIPNAGTAEGVKLAEKIIHEVGIHEFRKGDASFFVTMTIGVCAAGPKDEVDAVISAADKCLYRGKSGGKNRVES